ncbi:MAG TPA: ECF-type sigma factor [Bryobacteraceae bacterium]|nr:ECF-type sigma factor [Bryobacteraceae bacterium]
MKQETALNPRTEGEASDFFYADAASEDAETARLTEILYPELKRLAQIHMSKERPDRTLQPTELLSKVFLKLAHKPGVKWRDRTDFLRAASRAMRFLLIDYAKMRRNANNGGGLVKMGRGNTDIPCADSTVEYILVDRLLRKMVKVDPRMAEVVELKVFGGLTFSEIGEVLTVNERTAKRDWQVARAWLFGRLGGDQDDDG